MKSKKMLILLAGVVLAISVAACGGKANTGTGGTATQPPAGTTGGTVDAAMAEGVYKANCISCHAADYSGGVGPNLQKVGSRLSQDQIHAKISNGGNGMPAYKGQLKEEEITALSAWLAQKK